MTETSPAPSRSKRIYVLWGVALALLLVLGLFCWLVVVPVWRVRISAGRFAAVGDFRVLSTNWEEVAQDEVTALGGPQRAAVLLHNYLRLPSFLASNRHAATEMLGWCGEVAVGALLEAMTDDDISVRSAAARALGRIGHDAQGVVAVLTEALGDKDEYVRAAAAEALKKIKAAQELK